MPSGCLNAVADHDEAVGQRRIAGACQPRRAGGHAGAISQALEDRDLFGALKHRGFRLEAKMWAQASLSNAGGGERLVLRAARRHRMAADAGRLSALADCVSLVCLTARR